MTRVFLILGCLFSSVIAQAEPLSSDDFSQIFCQCGCGADRESSDDLPGDECV